MNTIYDYKRFAILYVDDEEKSLKYFTKALGDTFRIFTANNAADGYRLLTDHQDEIGIVMSDQRMPGEKGVQLLEKARRLRPQIIRILATAFAEIDAAIAAVNAGAIYKYITKPWHVPELETTLKRSLEFFLVQTERDLLLREKLSSLHRMLIADRILSLGVLAAGLGQHMRHTMDAVRKFLDLAPEMLRGENVDLDQLRSPGFWQEFHRRVQGQVKTVSDLLENLSSDSMCPYAFDTTVRLHEVIDEAMSSVAGEIEARGLRVVNSVPSDLPPLQVDGSRFRKLFVLLLRDEVMNLKEGGEVRFEATLRAGEGDAAGEVDLVVYDNGSGLPPGAILSVLDPLIHRGDQSQDYGIHLMACYFIVYHHGGRVSLRSSVAGGLAFTITLPLQPRLSHPRVESEEFLVRAMTNERLWERLLAEP